MIPFEYRIKVDIDNLKVGMLRVHGILNFDDTKDITFSAMNIWITKGEMVAGT